MLPDPRSIASLAHGAFAPSILARALLLGASFDAPHRLHGPRRWLLQALVRRAPAVWDMDYHGLKLRLYPTQNYCDFQIVMTGSHHEEDELSLFSEVMRGARVFVDIGANVGIYSLRAAQVMAENGRIVAFEPAPDTASKLRTNLALNGVAAARVIEQAVSDASGKLRLHVLAEENVGCNSLSDDLGPEQAGHGHEVLVTTLKSALEAEGVEAIDVLKIDVEGFEDRALLPYFASVSRSAWPGYVLLERTHAAVWKRDLIADMLDRGYEVAFENADNLHLHLPGAGSRLS